MGPFTPVADDMHAFYEREGVVLAPIGEDSGDLVLITSDRAKAVAAATAYLNEVDVDVDYVNFDYLLLRWAVFEWEPEDAECPWTVRWDASEGDDMAIPIFYLPA